MRTSAPPAATLTNTSAAVLGMVALGSRSGYEIQRAAERSLRFFWALGPPQVYSELRRLEAAGLVEGRDDAQGKRARRVFEVTDAGRAALRDWQTGGEPAAMELRDGELLRLFFADALEPAQARDVVAAIRTRSEHTLELWRTEITPAASRAGEQGNAFPAVVAGFGQELHEFIVGWCERTERQLAEGAGGSSSP